MVVKQNKGEVLLLAEKFTCFFDFRDENYDKVKEILSIYKNKEKFDSKNYTKGQFRRGVE